MGKIAQYPPALQEKARAATEARSEMFRNALKAGVKISFGTDAGVFPHGQNAHEFALWLEEIRGVRCGVITGPPKRPVPLRSAMLLPDKRLLPLINESGRLNPEILALVADERR